MKYTVLEERTVIAKVKLALVKFNQAFHEFDGLRAKIARQLFDPFY